MSETTLAFHAEIDDLRRDLRALAARIDALEKRYAAPVEVAPTKDAASLATAAREPARENETRPAVAAASPLGQGGTDAPSTGVMMTPAAASETGRGFDWEQVLGRNWFAIAGALALAIGIGFFLRLAFENGWIGTTERVLLGLALGLALIGTGQWAHGRYPFWAQAVTGSGLAVLYLSAYAAFGFYHLIGPVSALSILAAIAVLSGLLALRHESKPIALLGIAGAFLTPLLLGRELPGQGLFLAYLVLVDAGVLGISAFRNWRWLTLFGLAGSYLLFAVWLRDVPDSDRALAQVGLTAVFLVFVGATSLFHVLWRNRPDVADLALMSGNAAAYYAVTFGLIWAAYEAWLGLLSGGLAVLYAVVAYAARRRRADRRVVVFSVALGLLFITAAVPLQLGGSWITAGWATEGAVLLWVGARVGEWRLRASGVVALVIGTGHMLLRDLGVDFATYVPVANTRVAIFAFAIAAWYVGAYFYHRARTSQEEAAFYPSLSMALTANALTLLLLSIESATFFESQGRAGRLGSVEAHHYAYFTLTGIAAAYAVALAAVGVRRGVPALRAAGLLLLAGAAVKLVLFDVTLAPDAFRAILNARFATFAFVIAGAYAVAAMYVKMPRTEAWERHVPLGLCLGANAVTLLAFSVEVVTYFESMPRTGTDQAAQLALTLLWALYAAGLIAAGLRLRQVAFRQAGAALLAVTLAKVFVFDVFMLQQGYRVAAFVSLGVMLLGVAFVYQRYNRAVKGFLLGKS